ncbi:asparagine synthase-related protein [Corallococcus llansteffanensis]|uniref:asparagine synthase (glutamine-hydrolyzing) n=1 Tax=Corallococcus llansteffanensis TaxID=2316731 RepID=A0A3A8QNZ8_9BACT|nr:asparagine synthase C-terminal domain-containing protein [Corallococcus llansteffanensis]RKH64924.1 asparagine synthase [Corallococcus llansteffanensis]
MPTRTPAATPQARTPARGLSARAVADLLCHARATHALLGSGLVVTLPRRVREACVHEDEDTLAQRLLAVWSDTVRAHVEAGTHDVSLSGGVDSAALCAMAARHAPGKVRAWTMDVHFADTTERSNAQRMARVTGAELMDVRIPDAVLPDLFERAVIANQTVILNARAVASFAFYLEAHRLGAGPVLLSGAGADEVLRGTPGAMTSAKARVDEDRALAVEVLRPDAPAVVDALREASRDGARHQREGQARTKAVSEHGTPAAVDNLRASFRGGARDHEEAAGALRGAVDNLGTPAHGAPGGDQRPAPHAVPPAGETGPAPSETGGCDQPVSPRGAQQPVDNLRGVSEGVNSDHALPSPPVDNLGAVLAALPPPWDLTPEDGPVSEELRYAEWVLRELILPPELRGARAQGLTVRTPYLDAGFAEAALALPESVLLRDGFGKWLFRHAVRSLVPDEVRLARKTPRYGHTALSSPVRTRWLELYRAWLSPARLEPLQVIDSQAVSKLLERYTRLSPEDALAGVMDRLLMRLVSLAMLQAHTEAPPSCPES